MSDWSRDGMVRQSSYKGIERGRDPREVVREVAVDSAKADKEASAEAVPERRGARICRTSARMTPCPRQTRRPRWPPKPCDEGRSKAAARRTRWEVTAEGAGRAGRAAQAKGCGRSAARRSSSRTSTSRCSTRRTASGDGPITKRELIRYFAGGRAVPAAAPLAIGRSTSIATRTGRASPGFWQKDIPDSSAPKWLTLWHETGRRGAGGPRRERPPARGPRRDAVLPGQPRGVRDPRLDLDHRGPVAPDLRAHRHRPGHEDDLGRDGDPRQALPHRARAPWREGLREDHGLARHPGVHPDHARQVRLQRHVGMGREAVAGDRRRPSRTSSPGSGRRRTAAARRGSTTPRTRRSRRWSRRTPSGRATAPRSRCPSPGRSWTTRTSAPTAGRSGTRSRA